MSSLFYYEPFYNFDRFFDEAFNTRPARSGEGQRLVQDSNGPDASTLQRFLKPRMDLHEDANSNTVTASFEFPGIKKEDVSIDVHNGRLTVSAESKSSSDHDENGYAVRERRFGRYSRTLQLPQGVKDEEIKAAMQDGVLTVTFPKLSAEAAPKKITVA